MTAVDWREALPQPVAFVLSGGATLGAFQVGMLHALSEARIAPDLVVGTSVGALNGAVVAETGDVAAAARRLERVWAGLRTQDVFPGMLWQQTLRLLRRRSVHPDDGIRRLIARTLSGTDFRDLTLPLAVLATDALTVHPVVLTEGPLERALRASAAIPGVLPTVDIDGTPHWDGGIATNVPMRAALRLGAASMVVLDVGDVCHRTTPPEAIADTITTALQAAIRQRVLVEAPLIADRVPVLYLPRPCVHDHDVLDFARTGEFIESGAEETARFLADADPPRAGAMTGAPHAHEVSPLDRPLDGDRPAR